MTEQNAEKIQAEAGLHNRGLGWYAEDLCVWKISHSRLNRPTDRRDLWPNDVENLIGE